MVCVPPRRKSDLEFPLNEWLPRSLECAANELHALEHLLFLKPFSDDLHTERKTVHGLGVIECEHGAFGVVHVTVRLCVGEVGRESIRRLVDECCGDDTCGKIKLGEGEKYESQSETTGSDA